MRLCFVADLHGRAALYDQLTELLRSEQPEVVLLGGDLGPTDLGPAGIERQRAWLRGPFAAFLASATTTCRVILSRGNHDLAGAEDVLRSLEREGLLTLVDGRWVPLAPACSIAGFPFGPVSGWQLKDWERADSGKPAGSPPEDCLVSSPDGYRPLRTEEHMMALPNLATLLSELGSGPAGARRLLLCHHPPYRSGLDRTAMAGRRGRFVGSHAIRSWLRRSGLDLALHGHIHESPYLTGRWGVYLGRTLCVNPGQWGDRLHAVLFELGNPGATLTHTVFGRWTDGPAPRRSNAVLRAAILKSWQNATLMPAP